MMSAADEQFVKFLQVIKNASERPSALNWADDIIQSIAKLVEAMRVDGTKLIETAPSLPHGSNSPLSCNSQQPMISFANKVFCS